jgi:hypothetical protein
MANVQNLIDALEDGEGNALHASELQRVLQMEIGNTQEPTRDLIRKAVIENDFPIGSTPNSGYFLIDNEQEYQKTIDNLKARSQGLQRRISAITRGWERRIESRQVGGTWPK